MLGDLTFGGDFGARGLDAKRLSLNKLYSSGIDDDVGHITLLVSTAQSLHREDFTDERWVLSSLANAVGVEREGFAFKARGFYWGLDGSLADGSSSCGLVGGCCSDEMGSRQKGSPSGAEMGYSREAGALQRVS